MATKTIDPVLAKQVVWRQIFTSIITLRLAALLLSLVGSVVVLRAWRPVMEFTEIKFTGRLQLVLGMVLLGLMVFLYHHVDPTYRPKSLIFNAPARASLWRRFWLLPPIGVGMVMFVAFRENTHFSFLGYNPDLPVGNYPNQREFAVYMGGITLWILGFMRFQDPLRIWRRIRASWREHKREWFLVLGLTLAAFAIRVYQLSSGIPFMISDETAYLQGARRVAEDYYTALPTDMHRGDLYFAGYHISWFIKTFGATLFWGRITVAIVGSLGIIGVYYMTRKLFDVRAAILAAMFLGTQPLHVHFSRIALYDIYDPTYCILAVLLLWDGFERGGHWKFALAGVLVGVSQYYYAGALLWLILIPAWLGLMFLLKPRKLFPFWTHFLVLLMSVMVALFPMYAHFKMLNKSPLTHSADMSRGEGDLGSTFQITPYDFVFEGLSKSIRAFVDLGDSTQHFEYIPNRQLNNRWALLAFVLGLLVYLRYALNEGFLFLVSWLGFMVIFGGALMDSTPGYSRYVTAMLPMAMLAGIGVSWLAYHTSQWIPKRSGAVALLGGLALMLPINFINIHYIHFVHDENWNAEIPPSLLISNLVGQQAYESVKAGREPFFIFNSNGLTSDRWRITEAYAFYCGLCEFKEVDGEVPYEDFTEDWLRGLSQPIGVDFYIIPRNLESYTSQPRPYDSAVYVLRSAYPDARVQMFNYEYPSGKVVPLYIKVSLPPHARYCSREECRIVEAH